MSLLLIALPDLPWAHVLSFLTLRDEAALSRTCKEARDRCRAGKLRSLKRIFSQFYETDKLDVVALLGRGSYKRCADQSLDYRWKWKRCKWLDKYGPPPLSYGEEGQLLPQPAVCDYGECDSDADVTLDGRPMCDAHALAFICELCGKGYLNLDLAHCRVCCASVCMDCARVAQAGFVYCADCSRRITVDEHCASRK